MLCLPRLECSSSTWTRGVHVGETGLEQAPHRVAPFDVLDLDHLGAPLGEDRGGRGNEGLLRHLQDANALHYLGHGIITSVTGVLRRVRLGVVRRRRLYHVEKRRCPGPGGATGGRGSGVHGARRSFGNRHGWRRGSRRRHRPPARGGGDAGRGLRPRARARRAGGQGARRRRPRGRGRHHRRHRRGVGHRGRPGARPPVGRGQRRGWWCRRWAHRGPRQRAPRQGRLRPHADDERHRHLQREPAHRGGDGRQRARGRRPARGDREHRLDRRDGGPGGPDRLRVVQGRGARA